MRYIVIPDFLARLEETGCSARQRKVKHRSAIDVKKIKGESITEARFEKGLRGKVKKALRAKRK